MSRQLRAAAEPERHLDDPLTGEIERVKDFGVQHSPAITDPAGQVGVDLLGAEVVAAHLARYGHSAQRKTDKDAGHDGRDKIVAKPRPRVAKYLE